MAESIRLSALGRNVRVGDVYNYFTDAILPSGIQVPKECKLTPNRSCTFFYQRPDKFKSYMLGISSHLQNSIEKGDVDLEELWFANYMKPNPASEGNDIARVDVFIKVFHRIESLDQNFIDSKMYDYKLDTGGKATHLVEQVVYGAEFVCSMQRTVDWPRETKESVENIIYWSAKDYINQIIKPDSISTEPPVELRKISCHIFSSLLDAENVMEGSFRESILWLKSTIDNIDKDDPNKLKPIEIFLRHIPEELQDRLLRDELTDARLHIELNRNWITQESSRISKISTLDRISPLAKVLCQFRDLLGPLWDAIEKHFEEILKTTKTHEEVSKKVTPVNDLLIDIIKWLTERRREIETTHYLLKGTQLFILDIDEIKTDMSSKKLNSAKIFVLKVDYILDSVLEAIRRVTGIQKPNFTLPVLSIFSFEKQRFESIHGSLNTFADNAQLNSYSSHDANYYIGLIPVSLPFDNGDIVTLKYFSNKMSYDFSIDDPNPEDFYSRKVQDPHTSLQVNTSNVAIYPNLSSLSNFSDVIHDNYQEKQFQPIHRDRISTTSTFTGNQLTPCCEPQLHSDQDMEVESSFLSTVDSDSDDVSSKKMTELFITSTAEKNPSMDQQLHSDRTIPDQTNDEEINSAKGTERGTEEDFSIEETKKVKLNDEQLQTPTSITISDQKNSERPTESLEDESKVEITNSTSADKKNILKEHDFTSENSQNQSRLAVVQGTAVLQSNQRIAEKFMDEKEMFSKLIKQGSPNIYLLNATRKFNGEDIKWFDIGQLEGSLSSYGYRNHKVIILMGATGCGKSTLINGMVNYILGVRWNDPYRFKCVREDETTAKNQAHSQTSSVTAYTLRHHEGMAVPYSITIIDTPGYGDTRGVQRDKLITSNIHRFLTQEDTRVEEIHAACFVAASGDSRLTATQRYIIDSVLSIFGKDVKENIRLLVTFADNADPPVVEACRAANFPVTSASAGITYSKFNSSVLYSSNKQHGEDDFSFDELFWDMGQENFSKFFTMLQEMNGRNLISTRNVIQSRHKLEKSLKDIEQELEVCLINIENIEMFQKKMRMHGHNIETNKNFIIEKTEIRPTRLNCDKGFLAYNCNRCRVTCEGPMRENKITELSNTKRQCNKEFCSCLALEHEFQQFEWRKSPVKIKKTLLDMKKEFELSHKAKLTTEQLLVKCSDELNMAKAKVFSLLDQIGLNVSLLESTALRSNALTPSDYLSLMRSQVTEEQAPGYLTRLETLTELQNSWDAGILACESHMTENSRTKLKPQSHKKSTFRSWLPF